MKFAIKLNVIFLAAIILLMPLADMAICAECLSSSQDLLAGYRGTETVIPSPEVIHSTHCPHCKPDNSPFQNGSAHLCPICNNNIPLLSSINPQVNLLGSFFYRDEKNFPVLEIYSTFYIPPRNI